MAVNLLNEAEDLYIQGAMAMDVSFMIYDLFANVL